MFDHRALMSGSTKGPIAGLLRCGLLLASQPYAIATAIRNRRFNRGSTEIHHADVPVICIGNLTTGGTGKTPIVCSIAKRLRKRGLRVAIISRGYGRGENDHNDEAEELFSRLPDVPHIQDPDRVEAARIAVEELEAEIILMDDGYQHRRLHRDNNILVIDATCPFGYGHLLPRGLLRESLHGIARADLIVISRCDLVDISALDRITKTVQKYSPQVPIIQSDHQPSTLLQYPSETLPLTQLHGKTVVTVCAIGNPDAFIHTVEASGAKVLDSYQLPDHASFDTQSIDDIRHWLKQLPEQPDFIVCTHKDLVKLQTDRLAGIDLFALIINWVIRSGENELEKHLDGVIAAPHKIDIGLF